MENQPKNQDHILLFDADCAPCSKVANRLRSMNVSGLEAKALDDPGIVEILAAKGHSVPDRPTLLEIDGGALKLYQGFPMRLKLARRIGIRKAGAILGLLTEEARARAERTTTSGKSVSRRRLIGGAAAAGVGAAVLGTAAPSQASPASGDGFRALSPEESESLRDTDVIRQSLRVWGRSDSDEIYQITGAAGESIAMVGHSDPATATFVDLSDLDHGVTIQIDTDNHSLRYFLPGGTPLGEVTKVGDRVQVTEIDHVFAPANAEIEPQFSVTCFITCMAGRADVDCALACFSCVFGGWIGKLQCPKCAVCAGSAGLACARECN